MDIEAPPESRAISSTPAHGASAHLGTKTRTVLVDAQWTRDAEGSAYVDHVFTRSSAKGRQFQRIDFRYSIFDGCYFRDCIFDSCDFTGCRFVNSNFHGSKFSGCKFDYAWFEKTIVDSDLLKSNCPSAENLKLRFARTLRMNFQSIGEAKEVNLAVVVELDATREHLYKAWSSNEAYYRKKYRGWKRLGQFIEWIQFRTLDLLWGNGERPIALLRSICVVLILIAIADVSSRGDLGAVSSYWDALVRSPALLLGVAPSPFGELFTATIAAVRLVAFGLFVSILVRRFTRR